MREATVAQFMRRYQIDAAQAERVRAVSLEIYDGLAAAPHDGERDDLSSRLMLDWASRLAEIGLELVVPLVMCSGAPALNEEQLRFHAVLKSTNDHDRQRGSQISA